MKNEKKNTNNATVNSIKKVSFEDMQAVMLALDSNAHLRTNAQQQIAVQCFDGGKPATRCELWQRSAKHYQLYVGKQTDIFVKCEILTHKTYIDDKKMSKNELLLDFESFEAVKEFITTLTAKKEEKTTQKSKRNTKKKVESEIA